jgi:hypothetical protein
VSVRFGTQQSEERRTNPVSLWFHWRSDPRQVRFQNQTPSHLWSGGVFAIRWPLSTFGNDRSQVSDLERGGGFEMMSAYGVREAE